MISGTSQVKTLGLQFGRAFQIAIKTAAVFPIEHKSSERPIQQSFDFLNNLTRAVGQFTFGFVDNQVMLNNILTSDPSLKPLETECTKRGIAAITFEPGIAIAPFKKLIYLFAAPPPEVEKAGGFLDFLEQNPIPGLRVLAARKQNKNEQGDTIIESDSESYILARQSGTTEAPRDFLESIDALLESGCFDPAARAEALAGFAGSGDGADYGVPLEVPRMVVVKEGEVVVPAQSLPDVPGGGSGNSFAATAGSAPGYSGHAAGGGAPSGSPGTGSGFAGGTHGYGGAATGDGAIGQFGVPGGSGRPARAGAPETFLQLVEASVTRSLAEEKGSPEKSLLSLARLLRNTGVEKILEQFPAEDRDKMRALKPEQVAAEYIEDRALQLAGTKLKQVEAAGSSGVVVDEEVVQLLSRSLRATHTADRLAQKLAKFIQDFAVPPHVQEKIREELQWTSYSANKKFTRLMELKRYSNLEYRRFAELTKELLNQRELDRVATLVNHYFEFLDDANARIESTEMSRVPELVQSLSPAYAGFAAKTIERLSQLLSRDNISDFIHFQAANGLAVLGQELAAREEFSNVVSTGFALEKSAHCDPERHKKCCAAALQSLVPSATVERTVELYLAKRGDSAWGRTAVALLRFAAPESSRNVIDHLVSEADARNRMALVRLAGQLGSGCVEIAAKYLGDERWYVVRNMCGVLAELNDPNLVEHLAPTLRHADVRVQQAALKALVKARNPKVAQALADALPSLSPQVLDEALEQLMFLKSAGAIGPIAEFIITGKHNFTASSKAVQALATTGDVGALNALGRICRTEELDIKVRRLALTAIGSRKTEIATRVLEELASCWGELKEEARKELDKRQLK
jgi:HEAT repeat protein